MPGSCVGTSLALSSVVTVPIPGIVSVWLVVVARTPEFPAGTSGARTFVTSGTPGYSTPPITKSAVPTNGPAGEAGASDAVALTGGHAPADAPPAPAATSAKAVAAARTAIRPTGQSYHP